MNPSFCYIAPISHISDIADVSSTHLVLAHLVDTSPEYAQSYKRLSERGDFIMMDNSAYELKEPYKPEKLIELAHLCGAHAIVLPDYPFQHSSRTIDAAVENIPLFKQAGFKTFFVPQSQKGELADWIYAYEWAKAHPDIDIIGHSILGVPNALPHINPAYARVVMTQLLIDRGCFAFDKHNHFLGLNAGPALEIPSLLKMKALDTIDSSGPVWTAILGHAYTAAADSMLPVIKPTIPVDFHIKRTKNQTTLDMIQHNVALTQSLFVSQNERVWYAEE